MFIERAYLEALFSEEPSHLAFRAICSVVDNWSDISTYGEMMRLAESALKRWPSKFRRATIDDHHDALLHAEIITNAPSWKLVTAIDSSSIPETVEAINQSGSMNITHLRANIVKDFSELSLIKKLNSFDQLKSLDLTLYGPVPESHFVDFLTKNLPVGLEQLRLHIGAHLQLNNALRFVFEKGFQAKINKLALQVHQELLSSLTSIAQYLPPSVCFSSSKVRPDEISSIQESPEFAKKLVELSISGTDGDDFASALADIHVPGKLSLLNLESIGLTPAGAKSLCNAQYLRGLNTLILCDNPLQDLGCEFLISIAQHTLDTLDLSKTGNHGAWLAKLNPENCWHQLRTLKLSENQVTDDTLVNLFSLSLSTIRSLDFSCNQLSGECLTNFSKVNQWSNLRRLVFDGNDAALIGIESLSKCDSLQNLRELSFYNCDIGDDEFNSLCQGPWKYLRVLNLGNTNITINGLIRLNNASWRESVWQLCLLTSASLNDEGLNILTSLYGTQHLVRFYVPMTNNCSLVALRQLATSKIMESVDEVIFPFTQRADVFDAWLDSPTIRPIARLTVIRAKQKAFASGHFIDLE